MVSGLVLLGVVFSTLTFAWLAVYAPVTRRPAVSCERLAPSARSRPCRGTVMIGLGVRVVADAR